MATGGPGLESLVDRKQYSTFFHFFIFFMLNIFIEYKNIRDLILKDQFYEN